MTARRVIHLIAAVSVGLLATLTVSPHSNAGAATQPQEFVSLRGAGAWSVYGPLVSWQNDLASASSYVNMNYTPHGTLLGREDLVGKRADYAISGVPFADDDKNKDSFISAPLQATALAVFVEPTNVNGAVEFDLIRHLKSKDGTDYCNPDDDSTWPDGVTDPDGCYAHEKLNTSTIRVPNKNLGAMLVNTAVGGDPPTNAWNNTAVLQAMGLNPDAGDAINTPVSKTPPATALRSDGDEINYMVGKYVNAVASDAWTAAGGTAAIGERVLPSQGYTRDGAEAQIQLLANGGCGVTGTGCGNAFSPSGGLAPTPPAMITNFKNAFQKPGVACCQPILTTELQNAKGQWVAPTPESISKAVADTNGDEMFHALDHEVDGAYPLTWVDRIYMPKTGLSAAKTEGLAMMLRYLVTTGQDREASALEGRLSQPLVAQALAAANDLVKSNCTGSDRKIVESSDPGPLAPPNATAMKSIGNMLHCQPVGTAATTTTTINPGVGGAGNTNDNFSSGDTSSNDYSSVSNDTSSSDNSSASTANNNATANNTGSESTGSDSSSVDVKKVDKKSALLVVDTLPTPPPTGASATDRLAAFLLGVALYFLLRKPVARLYHRFAP